MTRRHHLTTKSLLWRVWSLFEKRHIISEWLKSCTGILIWSTAKHLSYRPNPISVHRTRSRDSRLSGTVIEPITVFAIAAPLRYTCPRFGTEINEESYINLEVTLVRTNCEHLRLYRDCLEIPRTVSTQHSPMMFWSFYTWRIKIFKTNILETNSVGIPVVYNLSSVTVIQAHLFWLENSK